MNSLWGRASKTWDMFSRRERVLVALTTMALPAALLFVLVIDPALKTLDGIDGDIQLAKQDVESKQLIIQALEQAKKPDLDHEARENIEALASRLNAVQQEISEFSERLVSPSKMLSLLQTVLEQNKNLTIVSAKSLAVVPVMATETQGAANIDSGRRLPRGIPNDVEISSAKAIEAEKQKSIANQQKVLVYKHSFEVELEGTYQALYQYLTQLEALHEGLFFEYLEYKAGTYPKGKVLLRVHTLSIDEGWIGA